MSAGLTREYVLWAYRILLDREPDGEELLVPEARGFQTPRELRNEIVTWDEYQRNNDLAASNERNLVIKEFPSGVRLVIDLADDGIGLNILRSRFELNELDYVRRNLGPGQHVIDVGAHMGLFTMTMAALVGPGGTVHAFEPLAENVECLRLGVRENRFEDRVTVEDKAVSNGSGRSTLALAPGSRDTGGAYLSRAGEGLPPGYEGRAVVTVALDEYPLPRPVSFIKMDAEGAEALVLNGAIRLLREDRPILLSELNAAQLERVSAVSSAAFVEQVNALGYRCHVLGAGVIGEELTHVPATGVTSLVFVPRDY